MISFVNILEEKYGMMYIKTHLKGVLDFSVIFDIGCLFIVESWNDVQKGSRSTLI